MGSDGMNDYLVSEVRITYAMDCPKCGTGYVPTVDPIGMPYQCEVCETVFMPRGPFDAN
jgi:uncharacterized OB-fold protein